MPSPSRIAERLLCLLAIPALAYGIYYSARVAVADAWFRKDTPQSLAQAVQVDPGNAAYHQLYAEHLESSGSDPSHERETAALLSPLDSRYWIDLGTLAETRSDFTAAERYYLKAASVDRKFAPRWALMNYYLRRHEEGPFWEWTQKAMPMAYGDVSEIFRLCWLMTDDAESIRRKIPQNEYMRSEYLRFLIDDNHLDAAVPVARDLAEHASPDDVDLLLGYCVRVMTSNMASAVEVWNTLSRRKLEPFAELDPKAGAIVTNGEFRTLPAEHGFDWYFSHAEEVSVTTGAVSGVSVELTGEQPEAITVLKQWVPVEAGATYRFDFHYDSDGADPLATSQVSGLAWEIEDPVTGAPLIRGSDLKTGVRGEQDHLDFTAPATPPGLGAAMLALRYERAPGTVRREEKITIEKVSSGLKP